MSKTNKKIEGRGKKPESKREEFRTYLEKSGLMDALTRVLVKLYEDTEKPKRPIEFFVENLTDDVHRMSELESQHMEMFQLRSDLQSLEEENKHLRRRLEKLTLKNKEKEEVAEFGADDPSVTTIL